jgi:molybdopterin molybdotransferase
LEAEQVALAEACGRVLAQEAIATRDQPPFAASAMDGYAVRSTDGPRRLRVVGESAAGAGFSETLQLGDAVRIFTGAPLPDGADCIVIQEDAAREAESVTVPATPCGQHVRPRGFDFEAGRLLLSRGARLDAIALALAAAAGYGRVSVSRRARVTIMTGGDEIVPPGHAPNPYQIYDSLSVSIAALLQAWGAETRVIAPQRDDAPALSKAYAEAFDGADLVVTIGGASVGDRDLMKPALAPFAPRFEVERIAVRPGKPTWFATTDRAPVLGLPGNPASALVCAHLFAAPLLHMLHGADLSTTMHVARLTTTLPANGAREHYLRARLSINAEAQASVTPAESQDSSLLSVFQNADALIRLAPHAPAMEAGAVVDVLPLRR